ncbi:MFS transporter [Streptomyces sp. NPDC058256]|uniref:MFS transporter n=1 Tax=Streptomyces sp. NPDC058256 TaxID=3346408 RepID=UPI0036E54252
MTEQTIPPAPQADGPGSRTPAEDAGRLDGVSTGRLVLILIALVMIAEIIPLQNLMTGVAIPKIAPSFPKAGAGITWAGTIMGVVGGATIALVGKLGDVWGKKRVVVLATLLFLAGTLICALTDNWALFLTGRGVCAFASGVAAVEYGLVRDLMPRRWIPICVAVLGTGFGLAAVAGPLLVGVLTDHYSWRSIFWFMLGYGCVALLVFLVAVPESPLRVRSRLDIPGALLFGAGVGLPLIYLSEGSSWGWGTWSNLAYLIAGLVCLAAFLVWETRTEQPMMELRLLRAPKVLFLMLISLLATGVFSVISIVVPYMFQTPKAAVLNSQLLAGVAAEAHTTVANVAPAVHFQGDISYAAGFSVLQLAVHVLIWTSVFGMLFAPIGGYLTRRIGTRLPLIIGLVAFVIASALWVEWHQTWQQQISIGVAFGLAFGFFFASAPNLLMDTVPAERQGVSSGMFFVFGSIGTAITTALFTAIAAAHPYQMVITQPTGGTITKDIPQVYDDSAYSLVYLLLGVVPAAIALVLALALRTGRTPARGGTGIEH